MLDLTGTTLHGRYVLGERIGVGAMGVVYAARHVSLGRRVAVKLLRGEHTENTTFRSRFEREARSASRIRHRNVVDILDLGDIEGGPVYIVMELLEGEDMRALLAREGALPPERARALFLQVLAGIDAAHKVGVVHRDIKPANCFIVQDERDEDVVKLLDFGVAKLSDEFNSQLTGVSEVIGTVSYLAPELTMGQPAHVGSDVYALGVMGFEMVTGTVPFVGDDMFEVMTKHLRDPPPSLAGKVPADLARVIERALAKEPEDRFETVAQMIDALRGSPRGGDEDDHPTQVAMRIASTRTVAARTLVLAPVPARGVPSDERAPDASSANRTVVASRAEVEPTAVLAEPRAPARTVSFGEGPTHDVVFTPSHDARRPPVGAYVPSVPMRSARPVEKTEVLPALRAPVVRPRNVPARRGQARGTLIAAILLASFGIVIGLAGSLWLFLR